MILNFIYSLIFLNKVLNTPHLSQQFTSFDKFQVLNKALYLQSIFFLLLLFIFPMMVFIKNKFVAYNYQIFNSFEGPKIDD
jgi:hypothetical protein